MNVTIILSEDRDGTSALQSLYADLVARLTRWADVDVRVLPHLYDLDPDGPGMKCLQSVEGDMVVLAPFFPRATYWLLRDNEVEGCLGASESDAPDNDVSQRTIWCLDSRAQETESLMGELERIVTELTETPPAPLVSEEPPGDVRLAEITQLRWYPIVDRDRCTQCLECLNFCLFGVFGIDGDNRLFVEQADACRNGCPACARVCPAQAIMFPQHDNPAIAGDPNAKAADLNVSLVQLLGSASPSDLAAAERDRAMADANKQLETSGKMDELDAIVDELDKADL